jgi:carbonic anhydrase
MHFHAPSEHTIDGEQFDLELHFGCGYSPTTATERYAIAFAILFNEGSTNDFFTNMQESNIYDFTLLDSDLIFEDYYYYNGSETHPPCAEILTMIVSSDTKELSSD